MSQTPFSSAPSPSKAKVFLRRLLTSIVLWTVVISALFSGNKLISDGVFLVIMMALAGFGLLEFYGLVEKRGLICFKEWGVFGGLLLIASTFFYLSGVLGIQEAPAKANDFETSLLIIFVLGLCVRQFVSTHNTAGILAISTTLFGLMYVPWLLNFIQKINFFPRGSVGQYPLFPQGVEGQYYLLYFLLITKFSDSGAYAVGSLIGKHKMIPRISPAKTWEGFGGAIAASTLASLIFTHVFKDKMAGMNPFHAVVLGVVLSVCAVVGELF